MLNLKRIAVYKIERSSIAYDEMEDFIKEWWSNKYKLPINHPLLLDRVLEDLLIEYFVDLYKSSPDELRSIKKELGLSNNDDDEKWFKKQMKDQYISEEDMEKLHTNNNKKINNKNTEEFEEKFN